MLLAVSGSTASRIGAPSPLRWPWRLRRRRLDAAKADVGLGARQRRRELKYVNARKIAAARRSTSGETPRVAHLVGTVAERVGVETHKHARTIKVGHDLQRASIGQLGSAPVGGVVGVPRGFRKRLQKIVDLAQQRRRSRPPGQQAKTFAGTGSHLLQLRRQRLSQGIVGSYRAVVQHRARAVGIVERQHRGFREHVGGAEARRMARIAFDLDRTSIHRGDDHAPPKTRQRQRRREFLRLTGNDAFGHFT